MRCRGPAEEFLFRPPDVFRRRRGALRWTAGRGGGVGAARRGIGCHGIGLLYSVSAYAQQRSNKSLAELQIKQRLDTCPVEVE